MQKNWYIIYTKPGKEKKTAALLTKRKIENFYPLTCKTTGFARTEKIISVPLFTSFVFVNTPASELQQLKNIEQVVNLVYWKGVPAIIPEDEINNIKEFSKNHQYIKVIPSKVLEDEVITVNKPSYSIEGNVIKIKNEVTKVNLPSLGYKLIIEMEGESVLGRQIGVKKNEPMLNS